MVYYLFIYNFKRDIGCVLDRYSIHLFSDNKRSVCENGLVFFELGNTVLPVLGTITGVEFIGESASAVSALGSLGFFVFYRKHGKRNLSSVNALATNLNLVVRFDNISDGSYSANLQRGNVNKSFEGSLAFAVECASIDLNESTEVNGADDGSFHHKRLVPSLFAQSTEGGTAIISA